MNTIPSGFPQRAARRAVSGMVVAAVFGVAVVVATAGCEGIDWLWWQGTGQQRPSQPRRVIRRTAPTLTGQAPVRPTDDRPSTDSMAARSSSIESDDSITRSEPASRDDSVSRNEPLGWNAPAQRDKPIAPAESTRSVSLDSPRAASSEPPPDGGDSFYQLLLLSEPSGAPAPDNVRQVQLRNARAMDVGAIVESLYVPVGPGGTDDRYFLIYESPAVWVAAQEMCRYLDVSPALDDSAAASDPAVEFEHALSRYYRTTRAGGPSKTDAQSLVTALSKSVLNTSLDRRLQWAAAMLAGQACIEWLQDTNGAVQFFMLARNRAGAGSPEELMAGAKLADTYAQAGDVAAARQANLDLLSRSASLSNAFAYRRAHGRALEQDKQVSSNGRQ